MKLAKTFLSSKNVTITVDNGKFYLYTLSYVKGKRVMLRYIVCYAFLDKKKKLK